MNEKFVEDVVEDVVGDVVEKLHDELKNKNFKWSKSIKLSREGNTFSLEIMGNNYKENMQNNAACFEGWAVILKTYFMGKNDVLELKCKNLPGLTNGKLNSGHGNRFLYRALRFSEQYKDWFRLETSLQEKVDEFKQYLEEHKEKPKGALLNNVPGGEFDVEYKNDGINTFTESIMEKFIYEHKEDVLSPLFKNSKNIIVNRQLPVGLFEGSVETKNKIFTGGKSAIDLWAYDPATPRELSVFELKFQNKMIGIISEIFFYANYMYDLLNKQGSFKLNGAGDDASVKRGYGTLVECNDKIEKINAVMLADKGNMHPVVTSKLLATLNKLEGRQIEYSAEEYEVKHIEIVGDIKILENK